MRRVILVAAGILVLAGCGSSGSSAQPNESPVTAINSFSPAPQDSTNAEPAHAPLTTAPSQGPLAVPGATGLLADPATISQRFPAATANDCAAAGMDPFPLGTRHAWRVGVALVCADVNDTAWAGRPVSLYVYFAAPISQDSALAVTQQLLPADASNAVFTDGTNNDASSHPNGACEAVSYDSPSARDAEEALNPSWKSDGQVDVVLYSGKALDDGSDSAYIASSVRFALVGIQSGRGADGSVTC